MKQFILDITRGVFVGVIVWYIIRPNEPIFSKFEDSVGDGKDILEDFAESILDYPPEQILMACGAGAILGFMVWISRKTPKKVAVKSRPAPNKKKK